MLTPISLPAEIIEEDLGEGVGAPYRLECDAEAAFHDHVRRFAPTSASSLTIGV